MTPDARQPEHNTKCRKLFINCDGVLSCRAPFSDDVETAKCLHSEGECEFRECASRQHTPAPEHQPCKYCAGLFCDTCDDNTCKFYPLKDHDAAIAHTATLATLKAILTKKREPHAYDDDGMCPYNECVLCEIKKSLREQGEQHPTRRNQHSIQI